MRFDDKSKILIHVFLKGPMFKTVIKKLTLTQFKMTFGGSILF